MWSRLASETVFKLDLKCAAFRVPGNQLFLSICSFTIVTKILISAHTPLTELSNGIWQRFLLYHSVMYAFHRFSKGSIDVGLQMWVVLQHSVFYARKIFYFCSLLFRFSLSYRSKTDCQTGSFWPRLMSFISRRIFNIFFCKVSCVMSVITNPQTRYRRKISLYGASF